MRARFRRHLAAGVGAALLTMVGFASALQAEEPSFQDIEESLTCQCGCGLTVHSCNHLQCGSAIPLRLEIRQQIREGKDRDAILAHFMERYGEKILSSPTTTGFNLTAWVMPFALIAFGGLFVAVVLVRWSGRRSSPRKETQTGAESRPDVQAEYERILERELKHFDR